MLLFDAFLSAKLLLFYNKTSGISTLNADFLFILPHFHISKYQKTGFAFKQNPFSNNILNS